MTLTDEEWTKLENECRSQYLPIQSRDELRSHFEANQQPQVIQSVTVESEIKIRDELGFKPRRKGTMHILYEESSFLVGGMRDLEDLILECVDAGINVSDYL